jgi:hypothetical protein|nr:MAG TPA: hypothetical protein [Caudoviricetes sp.]
MSKKDTTPLSTCIAKDLLISASYYKDSMNWALNEVLDHFKHKIDLSGYNGDKEELLDDITICDQPPEGFVFVFEIGHDLPVNIPVDKVLNYITEHGKITYNEFIKFSI